MSIFYSFHLSYSKPPRIIRQRPGCLLGLGYINTAVCSLWQVNLGSLWQVKVTSAHSTPRLGHSRVSAIEHPVLSFIVLMPQGSLKDLMFDLYYSPLFQDSFLSKHPDFPLMWYLYFIVIPNALVNKNICNELSQMFFFFNSALNSQQIIVPLTWPSLLYLKLHLKNLLESKAWTSCGRVQLMILLGRRLVRGWSVCE